MISSPRARRLRCGYVEGVEPLLPDDDLPALRPPRGGAASLQVTVRKGGSTLDNRVATGPGEVVPDYTLGLTAAASGDGYVVQGPDGPIHVGRGGATSVRHGALDVELGMIPRFRLPRFGPGSIDPTLPVLVLAVGLFLAQVSLLFHLYVQASAGGGFEPSPEYLARLLREDYAGAEKGLIARPTPRPQAGDPIESFYLQPGHAGPITRAGGGKNVGPERKIGDPDAKPAAPAAPAPVAGAAADQLAATPEPVASDAADAVDAEADAEADAEDAPIAVEPNEGWGFTDWYDTADARQDAEQIRRELDLAQQLLKLDPTDPVGLQIRAYYEYLAMDYKAARRTYETFTQLYPDEGSGWNNLALTYKRTAEYAEEEKYYRIALSLEPEDDAPLNNLAVNLAHQGRFEEAIQIMDRLEKIIPGDPYADLHRAKIYAAWGKEEKSYKYLQKSLSAMRKLDTLHNIEFRQDIRLDPAFETMRHEKRFTDLLMRYYGDRPEGWWQKMIR